MRDKSEIVMFIILVAIFALLALINHHEGSKCMKACKPYEAWHRLTRDDSTCYCRVGDHWELRLFNGRKP